MSMWKQFKGLSVVSVLGLSLIVFSGCTQADLVGKVAVSSFNALSIELDESVVKSDVPEGYELISPDGQRFLMAQNPEAGAVDLQFAIKAAPFIKAGLDTNKLGEGYGYDAKSDTLFITSNLGETPYQMESGDSLDTLFTQLVKTYRDRIGYHEVLDHYGVGFGNGNMFEWAKDMTTNDKDMVFVLSPDQLISAGLDPTQIEGWVFTQVEVKDENNKSIKVDKILQFYNLK